MKPVKVFLIILAVIVLAVGGLAGYFFLPKSTCVLPITMPDGGRARIHLPPKTVRVRSGGLDMARFRTKLSEDEVSAFYDDLFSNYEKVTNGAHSGYHDPAQGIVYMHSDIYMFEGKTFFTIIYFVYNVAGWRPA
ncbi:MAG: hypothetical protein FWD16_03590 [Clostridia bacterium]|nr:hypothetical protein [Clostridia bacterium]